MTTEAATIIRFLRIEAEGEEDLKLHSGTGSEYYPGSPWFRYKGTGGVISISPVEDTSRTSGTAFSINVALPAEGITQSERLDIISRALDREVIDKGVAVYQLEKVGTHLLDQGVVPQLILLAQVEGVTINAQGNIELTCYTAAAQLDRIYYKPSYWNDAQQVEFVDATDRGLRFANRDALESPLEFP